MPKTFRLALAAMASLLWAGAAWAGPMSVSSKSFAEHGMMKSTYAGDTCGGQGVSPQIAWADLPEATQSVAVLMTDPDGALGLGVAHWVAYNIDPKRGELKEGEANTSIAGVTVGKNQAGAEAYRGMCPPVGDLSHHYIITVIATDVAPGSLAAGLTRDGLLAALKGHALGGQSTIGLYSR